LVRPGAARRRTLAEELLLQLGVPVVLDVVVRPPRQLRSNDGPPEKIKESCCRSGLRSAVWLHAQACLRMGISLQAV
jgi:hypothetical protein